MHSLSYFGSLLPKDNKKMYRKQKNKVVLLEFSMEEETAGYKWVSQKKKDMVVQNRDMPKV